MPELHIIMGSNGAGKSSIGPEFLPGHIKTSYTVFDGDKLYMQKQKELWAQGIRAIKEAKNIAFGFVESTFEELVYAALESNDHFVYEGHFTNDATWEIPKKFRDKGYEVHILLSWPNRSGIIRNACHRQGKRRRTLCSSCCYQG